MNEEELLQIIEQAAKKRVTSLDLSGKKLKVLPPQIGQLTNLSELDLSGNQLSTLPPEIAQLTRLKRLILGRFNFGIIQGNQLTKLPPQISQLTNLTVLYLGCNQLSALPAEIVQLTNLSELDISGNELSTLPPEIAQLTDLTQLNLTNNQLSVLPLAITQLPNLRVLYLGYNQLAALPSAIAQLTNLTELELSRNQLSELPPEIGQLTNLTELELSGNQLSELPSEIGQLTNLELLEVDSNPLASPPPEIVNQGTQAILTYLQERLQGSKQQWVSKLLVVGEGGVGKTSLLWALRGEALDTHESTTHGIEIRTLNLPHPTKADVTMQLNTWDFGGQEIYHATHQFFLTNRSLFLLVWNARHGFEQGKLYYWLDTIQALAPESPILLVATHIDERDADSPLTELRRKYLQIIGQCEISSKTGKGIDQLRQAIADAAAKLPLMGEIWPTTWLNAANALRSLPEKRKYSTPQELWKFMAKHKVAKISRSVLARWLHELGEILYFRENEELNDIVILKPQWLTQYISKVLESEAVINSFGIFTRDCMDELWQDLAPSMRDHFLRLMERFDLSYRTLEDRDKTLVVGRLPSDLDWSTKHAVLSRLDQIEITIEEGRDSILEGQETILDELKNLRELTQREFTNAFRREQAKIDSHCPNVFVLRPRDGERWTKATIGQKLDLQLYCQAPGCWHPTQEGGLYEIDEPAKWLRVTAPYVSRLVRVLKFAVPIVGPWLGVVDPKEYEAMFKNNFELFKEVAAKLPEIKDSEDLELAGTVGEIADPDGAEGAALRALRVLLDEKDPQQYWGGLKKILTPEGHYLWLCEHHAAQYKP